MIKKISLLVLALVLVPSVAFAADETLGAQSTPSNGAAGLDTLQPADPSLQTATGVSTDTSSLTGTAALQPAGNKQVTLNFIGSDIDSGSVAEEPGGVSLQNGLLLGVSALGFLVTAGIIFRTSKRLETITTGDDGTQ